MQDGGKRGTNADSGSGSSNRLPAAFWSAAAETSPTRYLEPRTSPSLEQKDAETKKEMRRAQAKRQSEPTSSSGAAAARIRDKAVAKHDEIG